MLPEFAASAPRAIRLITLAILLATTLTGCGASSIRGRVVEGDASYIAFVSADDPRFEGRGVSGVSLQVETDPGKLKRKQVGEAVSGADGQFEIPLDAFGAGVLEYDFGVTARRRGYESADLLFRLSSGDRRMLVIMRPVHSSSRQDESLMDQYERFRR